MVQRESEVGGARRIERKAAVTIFTAAFHTWGHDLQHAHTCLHMPSLATPPQQWDTPSPGGGHDEMVVRCGQQCDNTDNVCSQPTPCHYAVRGCNDQ